MNQPGGSRDWEYACIVLEKSRRQIHKNDPEFRRLPKTERLRWVRNEWSFYWWREHKAYVWFPGDSRGAEHLLWEEFGSNGLGVFGLLNDLGSDGWELAAVDKDDTMMVTGENLGWAPTSAAIRTRWYLKRPRR